MGTPVIFTSAEIRKQSYLARVTQGVSGRAGYTPRQSVPSAPVHRPTGSLPELHRNQGAMLKQGPFPQDDCEMNSDQQMTGLASTGPWEAFLSLAHSDGWGKNSCDWNIGQENHVLSPKSSSIMGAPQHKAWAPVWGLTFVNDWWQPNQPKLYPRKPLATSTPQNSRIHQK